MSTSPVPEHGKIACVKCFDSAGTTVDFGPWRFRNDPGHWGASNPRVLVLGFSKGSTQVDVYDHGNFDDVAFAGCRDRLKKLLVALNLITMDERIDEKFRANEQDFGFASLIRCSVARRSGPAQTLRTSGDVVLRAFKEAAPARLIGNCSRSFLKPLPTRLQVVVMLGIQDKYVEECRMLVGYLYGSLCARINDVAYRTDAVVWVHAAHPSGANGWFDRWLTDAPNSSPMALKRELAQSAIQHSRYGV